MSYNRLIHLIQMLIILYNKINFQMPKNNHYRLKMIKELKTLLQSKCMSQDRILREGLYFRSNLHTKVFLDFVLLMDKNMVVEIVVIKIYRKHLAINLLLIHRVTIIKNMV